MPEPTASLPVLDDCCAPSCCEPAEAPASTPVSEASPEDDVRALVREKYGALATERASCCDSSCCGEDGGIMAEDYAGLEGYVPEADLNLGCGLPTEHAGLRPGDTVLDLGSGAGNDVFVAARIVGPEGLVVGVDMTPEMVDLARENARKIDARNVSFRLGEIEHLPVADASVDVVVSNCVLNLVPDKRRAFAEIRRALRPGGHFCISDIVVQGVLPARLRGAAELYVGCVAGAMERDAYLGLIREAGFEQVDVPRERRIDLPEALLDEYLSEEEARLLRESGASVWSITVLGRRSRS